MISYMTHSIHYLEYKKLECHADASGLVQQVRGLLACNCQRVAYEERRARRAKRKAELDRSGVSHHQGSQILPEFMETWVFFY